MCVCVSDCVVDRPKRESVCVCLDQTFCVCVTVCMDRTDCVCVCDDLNSVCGG